MRNRNIFELVSRLLSLFIAGIDFYVAYWWYLSDRESLRGPPLFAHPQTLVAVGLIAVLAVLLAFVWFGDSLAEFEHSRQRWCPASLVKFMGWVLLVIFSILIFVCCKKI